MTSLLYNISIYNFNFFLGMKKLMIISSRNVQKKVHVIFIHGIVATHEHKYSRRFDLHQNEIVVLFQILTKPQKYQVVLGMQRVRAIKTHRCQWQQLREEGNGGHQEIKGQENRGSAQQTAERKNEERKWKSSLSTSSWKSF